MRTLVALSLVVTLTAPALAQDCEHSAERTANVPLNGAKRVVIAAGAGELNVRGEAGRNDVEARGQACASSAELLSQLQLETRREADAIYIRTVMPSAYESLMGLRYARLDLTVTGPHGAHYSIEDTSGDLQVANVQSAAIADSSGDQSVRDVAGDLEVTDSSGDVELRSIGGKLTLTDSSGDVEIADVRGAVKVQVDSSGDLDIHRVESLHIVNDSSGSIVIGDVKGDVSIDVDTSGDIRVERVGGSFTVGADSSGDLTHRDVRGVVRIPPRE